MTRFGPIVLILALTVLALCVAAITGAISKHTEAERLAVDEVDRQFYTLPGLVNEGTQQK